MRMVKSFAIVAGHILSSAFPVATFAAPIIMEFSVPDGYDVSFNGAPDAPSGAITLTVMIDNTAPDLLPVDITRGAFAITSASVTAPALGLSNEPIVGPFEILTFNNGGTGGIAMRTPGNIFGGGGIGWNDTNNPDDFMGDSNDLSTLPLPTNVAFDLSYIGADWTMASGDTLEGSLGGGGPAGTFTAYAVPEPSTLAITALGILAITRRRNSPV